MATGTAFAEAIAASGGAVAGPGAASSAGSLPEAPTGAAPLPAEAGAGLAGREAAAVPEPATAGSAGPPLDAARVVEADVAALVAEPEEAAGTAAPPGGNAAAAIGPGALPRSAASPEAAPPPGLAPAAAQAGAAAGGGGRGEAPPPAAPGTAPPMVPALAVRQVAPVAVALALLPGPTASLRIALEPPELGRVEVRIARGAEGDAVRILVERPETLALLQRDQRELARALDQAGVPPGGGISLGLAGREGGGAGQDGGTADGRQGGGGGGSHQDRRTAPLPPEALPRRAVPLGLLDIAV